MSLASEHAQRWVTALTSDTAAAVALYADDLVYDDHADSDHVIDTAITKAELEPRLAPFANTTERKRRRYPHFTATEAFQLAGVNGNPAVVILWDWTGEGCDTYRGVPTGARPCTPAGSPGTSSTGRQDRPRDHLLERHPGATGTRTAHHHAGVLGRGIRPGIPGPVVESQRRGMPAT